MRRAFLAIVSTAALMVATAGSALADGPGTNFPEQPGGNVQNACAAVLGGPGQGLANASPTALVIVNAMIIDACFGG
jgi:hypothetical protein